MKLEAGMTITAIDAHSKEVRGKVIEFLEHTVIIEYRNKRYVIRKSELRKQGYSFPRYEKKRKNFSKNS